MKNITYYLERLDREYRELIKYIGMIRLLRAVLGSSYAGGAKTWESSLFEALDTLNARESKILKLRFGLLDSKFRTLEEVGKEFGVTRERIRGIEGQALRKLRHPSRKYVLLGASWQIAVQEAKQMGEKLLLRKSEEMEKDRQPVSYVEVENMGLPTRVYNALLRHGYKYVYDLIKAPDYELLRVRNLGLKSVKMIRYAIDKLGIKSNQ